MFMPPLPANTTAHCTQTWYGQKTPFGQVPTAQLYGDKGWCVAAEPEFRCPCILVRARAARGWGCGVGAAPACCRGKSMGGRRAGRHAGASGVAASQRLLDGGRGRPLQSARVDATMMVGATLLAARLPACAMCRTAMAGPPARRITNTSAPTSATVRLLLVPAAERVPAGSIPQSQQCCARVPCTRAHAAACSCMPAPARLSRRPRRVPPGFLQVPRGLVWHRLRAPQRHHALDAGCA